MRRAKQPLESAQWTSMIDIIFQLMIFFLVTMSILPSISSADQVEGNLALSTPSQGASEVSHLIQVIKIPFKETYGYLVLDGTPQSAEYYKEIDRTRDLLGNPYALQSIINLATIRGLWFDDSGLMRKFEEAFGQQDVKVIISAAREVPYGEIVKVHSILFNIGVSKIAWLDRPIAQIKAEIKEMR